MIMLPRFALIIAGLLAAVTLSYSSSSREPRADLTYVNTSDIHTLDPARMSWITDFRVALNIWEGLSSWHPQTVEPIAGAAEFPPRVSDDGLTYTFTLREDGRWSNGDPVTASDFVRGWRRGLEPGTAADYTFLLTEHVAGAADYAGWRRRCVAALTALARLADGWSITKDQARALTHPEVVPFVRRIWPDFARESEDKGDSAAGGAIPIPDPSARDWFSIHAAYFAAHVEQLDIRFAAVGLRTPDARTLVVQLARPCTYFPDLAAMPLFLPCHESIELLRVRHDEAPINRLGLVVYDSQWTKPDFHRNGYPGLVTNGAYRLTDWTFKRRARLSANPYYHDAASVRCRTVEMLVYDNLNAALMAYESGHVDLLPDLGVPYVHEMVRLASTGQRPDFHLAPVLATYFFNFNCSSESVEGRPNPFRDSRVRRAFAQAADKEMLVHNVRARGDRVAHSFVPAGGIPGYEPPNAPSYDPAEARRWLAEAGFAGGSGFPPVSLLYTQNDERLCQSLARNWELELGVRVELGVKESKTFGEDKKARRFMIARGNWFADYNDPTTFLDCLQTGNGNNDSGYSNPEYDELLARAASTADASVRRNLLQQAEGIVVSRDFPVLPILHFTEPIAIHPRVRGLYPNPRLWFPFRFARVEGVGSVEALERRSP
jgi:oligopeptide transport system substrate-binding protein